MEKEEQLQHVVDVVLDKTNISEEVVMSKDRRNEVVAARRYISYFGKQIKGIKLNDIAIRIGVGRCDVLYHRRQTETWMKLYSPIRKKVKEISAALEDLLMEHAVLRCKQCYSINCSPIMSLNEIDDFFVCDHCGYVFKKVKNG